MAAAVYILGMLVALACGALLFRGYLRGRQKLLLWSSLCFLGLAVSNLLVFLDLVMFPDKDLYLWRLTAAAVGMMFLLYGLIWEGE
jgi:predicted lysophospholipase L1 biosynthesis ABC-type transport system permease subunit